MKITPLEIKQKTFEKSFRGFDKEEVISFLGSLSQEWERLMGEIDTLKRRLEDSEKEVEKRRKVESSLFNALKTAEDTGNKMISQASKDAELIVKESQTKAMDIVNEAKQKAREVINEAEAKAKEVTSRLENDKRSLEHINKNLEDYRDDLTQDLRKLSSEILSKIERIGKNSQPIKDVKETINKEKESKEDVEQAPTIGNGSFRQGEKINKEEGKNSSFFDQIN